MNEDEIDEHVLRIVANLLRDAQMDDAFLVRRLWKERSVLLAVVERVAEHDVDAMRALVELRS